MADNNDGIPSDTRADEIQAARGILGPDTFQRKDLRSRILPDISEGAGAVGMLRRNATPSDLVRTYRGSLDQDIQLPSDSTKPVAKPQPTTKPIAKPRSLAGGGR